MKSLLLLFVSTIAFSFAPLAAQAEVKTGVNVSSVSFDGRILEVGYYVGGGCAEHRGDVEFSIDATTRVVTVNVVDITEAGDGCEALIPGSVKVDVIEKLKGPLADLGLDTYGMKLVLPTVRISGF